MRNIKLNLSYDGTKYLGFQRQSRGRTIQGTLEEAINTLLEEKVNLIGCSRTDAKVHAKEYIANFKTESNIPADRFCYAINSYLPKDILIIKSEEAAFDFHSRYDCIGKTYVYTILNSSAPSPLYREYHYYHKYKLSISLMEEASRFFIGEKDFSAFKSTGSFTKSNIRNIKEINVYKDGDYIKVLFTANGFLYNMVRIICGTLVLAGEGKIKPEYIKTIIEDKDRKKAGIVLPPQGLCLEKVYY